MPRHVPSQRRPERMRKSIRIFLCCLSSVCGNPAAGQSCIGLASDPNSTEVSLRLSRQGQGYRVGGRASANVAGFLGVDAGAAGGKIDRFATNGSEVGGLLWVSPIPKLPTACLLAEYDQSEETLRNGLGLDRGNFRERWIRFGIGYGLALGSLGGSRFAIHGASEVIGRKANLKGRTLYADTTVYILETEKQNVSTHLGGRCILSVRRENHAVLLFLRTRPRIRSDLEWGIQVHLPI